MGRYDQLVFGAEQTGTRVKSLVSGWVWGDDER